MVDDHRSTSEGVAESLRGAGFMVDTVRLASQVPAEVAVHEYDLALVDMLFSEQDESGLDVLESISRARPSTRLVLFTAGEDVRKLHLAQAFKQFDIKGALPKGMRLQDVVLRVTEILDGYPYFDPELEAFRPLTTEDPCVTLMKTPAHEAIWIALAEGTTRAKDLARRTGYMESTVRVSVGEMADKLIASGLVQSCDRNLASLASFAASHEEFFLNWKWRTVERGRAHGPSSHRPKRSRK